MSQIHDTLTAISQMSPAEFKQMAVLAESIVKYNVLFIAWLNSMRRRSRHELQGLWKARHGDIMVRLTADVMQLARTLVLFQPKRSRLYKKIQYSGVWRTLRLTQGSIGCGGS